VPLPTALVEFALNHRSRPAPGIEVMVTPRYQITLQPDFPIPGPNSVSWIRCGPGEADEVIVEARASVAPRHLPMMWVVDPGTEPANFADYLEGRDIHPDPRAPEVAVMALPIEATIESPEIAGLQFHDALADLATFRRADAVGKLSSQSCSETMPSSSRLRNGDVSTSWRRATAMSCSQRWTESRRAPRA
jgi:hypothetical protein